MPEDSNTFDGFRFLPPSLRAWIKKDIPDPTVLLNETMPQVADKMREDNVEAVFLTPA